MAQSIILKRSALQGKVPTTSSLSLGEIAINTYDGKLYLNRSGSTQSIQEIITTNVVNTGSITLTQTGSFAELVVSQDGNFKRDVYVTRDIITNGSLDILYDVTASAFLGTIRARNGVISGSSQVNFTQISGISAGIVSSSTQLIPLLPAGTISGSSAGIISSSAQLSALGYATTGSNSFKADQQITGSLGVSGDITVLGSVNARQFNIGIISSSVIYQSGSTKFGDTGDDIMSVTGSLRVSGSQTITGSVDISGSLTMNGNILPISDNTITLGKANFDYNNVWTRKVRSSGDLTFQTDIYKFHSGTSFTEILRINASSGSFIFQNGGTFTDNGYKLQISGSSTGSLYVTGSSLFNGNIQQLGSQTITGSVTATSFTGSLFGTASYALNGSSNAIMYQTASAASTWVFNHFLATPYPVVTVYDNNNSVIIPQSIVSNDSSSLTITFSSARTGVAVASKGGYVGSSVGTATTATALLTARLINGTSFDGTQNITIPNLVSGSTQISLAGTSDYSSLFGGIASTTASLNTFTSSINGWSGSVATTGSNTFRGNQTITGSLFVSGTILQNRGALAVQDGTTLYHTIPWFTPSSTVSTSATTVTSVGTQFTSGMVGARLTILGESRIITAFTSNTQVTVDSAYSQNYSGVASGNWGVFSISFLTTASDTGRNNFYGTTGGRTIFTDSNNNYQVSSTYAVFTNLEATALVTKGGTISVTSAGNFTFNHNNNYVGTKDLGIRRNNTGSLEIYDGVTAGSYRDLILRDITGSNAFFSGSTTITGSLGVSGSITANTFIGSISATNGVVSGSSQVIGILSSLNTYTGSNDTKFSTLATLTGSIDAKFVSIGASTSSLNTYTASTDTRFSALQASTASLNVYTQSNDTLNTTQNSRLTALETATGSNTSVSQSIYYINNYTGSAFLSQSVVNNRLSALEIASSSLEFFTSSQNTKNTTLATYTGSVDTKWANLAVYTASVDTKFAAVQSTTNSLNLFTSSILTALTSSGVNLTANGSLTVQGNLIISGTTTTINSQTLNIGDNIIELNYGGTAVRSGIYTKDATGASLISGSFLWDATNDYWIAGISGSESRILVVGSMGVVSGSSQISIAGTSDYSSLFGGIASATSSLNSFSASENTKSSTLATYTGSIDTKFTAVAASTASLNLFTSSAAPRLTNLETTSASVNISVSNINSFTASVSNSIQQLSLKTGSYATTGSNAFIGNQTISGSLSIGSASVATENTLLVGPAPAGGTGEGGQILLAASGGLYTSASMFDTYQNKFRVLRGTNAASDAEFLNINLSTGQLGLNKYTGSGAFPGASTGYLAVDNAGNVITVTPSTTDLSQLNSFTASAALRLTNLESTSASVNISISNLNTYSASVSNSIQQLNSFTASNANTSLNTYTSSISDPKFVQIGASTSSLNLFTASAAIRLTNLETTTASLNISVTNLNTYSASVSNSIQQLSLKTGSYATTGSNSFNGNQIVTGSLTVTSLTTIATSLTTNSSSFVLTSGSNLIIQNNGLAEITGSLRVSGSQIVTGSVTATSFTGSLLGTASFATSASYALNGSSNAFLYQTASAASVWTFNHYLQTRYPIIQIYDNTDSVIIPQSITAVDNNTTTITFSSPRTGTAVASKGGYVGSVVTSATTATSATSASVAVTSSYAISASAAATTFSIGASSTTYGSYINTIQGANTVITTPTGSFAGAFYNYVATSGSNARAGQVMAIWNNTTTQFTDVTTNDIGSTTMVTSSVALSAGSAVLSFTTNTNGWNIKTFVTYL
jgi:hypothetical protein